MATKKKEVAGGKEYTGSEPRNELFHSTLSTLRPGDLIEPRLAGQAFASKDVGVAVKHTAMHLFLGREGYENPHHGNLYSVDPLENDSSIKEQDSDGGHEVVSNKGFRVKEHIGSIIKPQSFNQAMGHAEGPQWNNTSPRESGI